MLHEVFAATSEELTRVLAVGGIRETPSQPARQKRSWSREQPPARQSTPLGVEIRAIEIGSIDDVGLATLEALLSGESITDVDALIARIQEPLYEEPKESPEAWISPISPTLATALAAADRARLEAVVDEWVATEEMTGWGREPALDVLVELADFVRQTQADGREVFRIFRV